VIFFIFLGKDVTEANHREGEVSNRRDSGVIAETMLMTKDMQE
jgi:hypothetical protein